MKRILNEAEDEKMLDTVVKECKECDDSQEPGDDRKGGENATEKAERTSRKSKTAVAVLGYIQVLRQIESHPYLAETFLRENLEDLLPCIEEAIAKSADVENPNNIALIFEMRDMLAKKLRPQNGVQQDGDRPRDDAATEQPGALVTDDNYGDVHG